MHGHVLRANIVPISLFLNVPHYFGDVGRPEYREDPGSDLSSKGSFRPHQKRTDVPSGLLQPSIVTTQMSLSLMGTSDVRNGCPDRVRIYSLEGYLPTHSWNTRPCVPDGCGSGDGLVGTREAVLNWFMNTILRVHYSYEVSVPPDVNNSHVRFELAAQSLN